MYPSVHEGFGLPPVEAMACGVPVVLARNSALAEFYGDGSLMVEEPAADSLARAVATLAERPELRARLTARGAQRARARVASPRRGLDPRPMSMGGDLVILDSVCGGTPLS